MAMMNAQQYRDGLAPNNSHETVEAAIRAGLRKVRAPNKADSAAPMTA
jgi:hypothetical protein